MRSSLTILLAIAFGLSSLSARAAVSSDTSAAKDVETLEMELFHHDYPADTMDDRLTRLEKMVFGEARTGSDDKRAAELAEAVKPETPDSSSPGAGSLSQASNLAAAGKGTAGAGQKNSDDDVIVDSSQYPHITALEHELLGQTHADDSVGDRLDQLEIKAFGKPSMSNDLSERTDRLEHYVDVHLHKTPYGQNPAMEVADTEPINYNRYTNGAVPVSYSQPAAPRSAPVYMPAPGPNSSMLDKVAWMEGQVYGETYMDEHLLERLRRLNQTLFPNEPPVSDMKLMDQVDSLIGAVELIQTHRRVGAGAQTIASQPSGSDAYRSAESEQEQGAQEETAHPELHKFARGLAHCLGEAGNMALGMSGNGYMGQNGAGYWY
jgi:hypothetical protein